MTARFSVRLTPRGGKDATEGWQGDVLKVRVSAAPVDGKANDAVLRLLAKALGMPPSRLTIVAGASGRTKVIEVEGISLDEVRARIS